MNKIINNEQDIEASRKARRILTSVKAAALAGVIMVGSVGFTKNTKAQEVVSPEISVESDTDLVDELDSNFTWEFDDGVDRDNLEFTGGYHTQTSEISEASETEEVVVEETTVTEEKTDTESKQYYKFYYVDDLVFYEMSDTKDYSIPKEPVRLWSMKNGECVYEDVDFSKAKNVRIEYLLYLDDVDPDLVDENYTGIAPLTYYGPEHVVKNYGDASNDEEVRERAMVYWNAFHKANEEVGGLKFVDPDTGKEYTVEKIMDIIKYINGAYIAKDGAEAREINDDWLNFILVFLNDDYLIEDVNYKANSDVITEEDVKQHSNILENIDLGHLLMGDSSNGPFLQWYGDQIEAMYKTTDREEAIRIYDETYKALMAITEANGYIINGVEYKINDFANVNDMVLVTQVLIGQVLRNTKMESGYALNKKYVGLEFVFLTRVLDQFNAVCSEDLVNDLKNNGVEVYEGVTSYDNGQDLHLRNYASVMQMKAIDMALANGQYGIKYYQDSYLVHYDEYVAEKNGGTYEDVLESSYVYKKASNK